MMKKRTLRKRISYWIDCMMSKGPVAMCILLFAITVAIVVVIGVIVSILGSPEPPVQCLRATLPEKGSHVHYERVTL